MRPIPAPEAGPHAVAIRVTTGGQSCGPRRGLTAGVRHVAGRILVALMAIALVVAVTLVATWMATSAPGFSVDSVRDRVESAGPVGPLVFVALLAGVVILAPIPNTPFYVVAGVIWGPWVGSAYSMAGLAGGSFVAFWLARRIPRRAVAALVGRRAWSRMSQASETVGPWAVAWARLLPATNFDWINYLAGLTPIRPLPFFVATTAGVAPATIATVVAGSAIEDNRPLALALTVAWLVAAGVSALFAWRWWSPPRSRIG